MHMYMHVSPWTTPTLQRSQPLPQRRDYCMMSRSGLTVPRGAGLPFDPQQHALNILDGRVYLHHPVMRASKLRVFPLDAEAITEWNGLLVPAAYDCDMYLTRSNKSQQTHWGTHWYFFEVPTRWAACQQHRAALESGIRHVAPMLPMVDDEYLEHVAVWHSVLRASHLARTSRPGRAYVFGELGARWGTWSARAGAFARSLGLRFELLMVEAAAVHCKGIRRVMTLNDFSPDQFRLDCEPAGERYASGKLREWLLSKDMVDALDIDIQGAELHVVGSLMDVFDVKVARLIIGTHK
jgi:hypothetical protein